MVGRRAVQRPAGLEQAARLSTPATERRGAGVRRRPHRAALRHGRRLGTGTAHGPAGGSLDLHQGTGLLRPDHPEGVRRQGLLRPRPFSGGDEARHPQRRPGVHRDGAELPRPGRTAVALRHRRAAPTLPAPPGKGRGHPLLRPDQPAGRLRRRRHDRHWHRLQRSVGRRGSARPAPDLGEALHHPRPHRYPARPGLQVP
ncbi:hypothetical protein D9M71_505260 [compost metagenome]